MLIFFTCLALFCAVLCSVVPCCAVMCHAVLCCAKLSPRELTPPPPLGFEGPCWPTGATPRGMNFAPRGPLALGEGKWSVLYFKNAFSCKQIKENVTQSPCMHIVRACPQTQFL